MKCTKWDFGGLPHPAECICRFLSSAYILLPTNTGRLESNNHSYPSGFESRPRPALNSSISSTPRPKLSDTYPRENATPRPSLLSFLFISVCRKIVSSGYWVSDVGGEMEVTSLSEGSWLEWGWGCIPAITVATLIGPDVILIRRWYNSLALSLTCLPPSLCYTSVHSCVFLTHAREHLMKHVWMILLYYYITCAFPVTPTDSKL